MMILFYINTYPTQSANATIFSKEAISLYMGLRFQDIGIKPCLVNSIYIIIMLTDNMANLVYFTSEALYAIESEKLLTSLASH